MTKLLRSLKPIQHSFHACGHEHLIEFSYGFASIELDESFESVFRRADTQMRQLKTRLYATGQTRERRNNNRADDEGPTSAREEDSQDTLNLPRQIIPISRHMPAKVSKVGEAGRVGETDGPGDNGPALARG